MNADEHGLKIPVHRLIRRGVQGDCRSDAAANPSSAAARRTKRRWDRRQFPNLAPGNLTASSAAAVGGARHHAKDGDEPNLRVEWQAFAGREPVVARVRSLLGREPPATQTIRWGESVNSATSSDTIVKEININAPAARVFEALSDPSQRLKWWGVRILSEFQSISTRRPCHKLYLCSSVSICSKLDFLRYFDGLPAPVIGYPCHRYSSASEYVCCFTAPSQCPAFFAKTNW